MAVEQGKSGGVVNFVTLFFGSPTAGNDSVKEAP